MRTTPDPRSGSCSPPPERWGAEAPLGSPKEYESRPVPPSPASSRSLERRGRRFPGTHLEPVVNISPGFPSTNSSARALPSPNLARSRGPAFPQLPLLPPPAGPPARHSPARPGCEWGRGGGRWKGSSFPCDCQIENSPVLPSAGIPTRLA